MCATKVTKRITMQLYKNKNNCLTGVVIGLETADQTQL